MKKILFQSTTILAILFLVVNCTGANDVVNCEVATTKDGKAVDSKKMICAVANDLSMLTAQNQTDEGEQNTVIAPPTEQISLHRLSGDFKENEGPGTPTYTLPGHVEIETKTWIWKGMMPANSVIAGHNVMAGDNEVTVKLMFDATQNNGDDFNCNMIATENGTTVTERMICEVSGDFSTISSRDGPLVTSVEEVFINRLTGELKENSGEGTPTYTYPGAVKVKTKTWKWRGSTFIDAVTVTLEDTQ